MQAIDLAQKVMGLFAGVHSQVAIDAMDICRVLIRERDFNEVSSRQYLSELPQEISQFDREPELTAAGTAL